MYPDNSIVINMDAYLSQFVIGMLNGKNDSAIVPPDHYVGTLLHRMLDKVPENCNFVPPVLPRKKQIKLFVNTLGRSVDTLKRPQTYYYFPVSKQIEFEKNIRVLFDQLFFNVISIAEEYTDEQIRKLIERFCDLYNIDYAQHSDALIKKYYRARKLKYAM